MKALVIALTAMMVLPTAVSAQFTNSNPSSKEQSLADQMEQSRHRKKFESKKTKPKKANPNYFHIGLGYDLWNVSMDGYPNRGLQGAFLELGGGFALSQKMPLYLTADVRISYVEKGVYGTDRQYLADDVLTYGEDWIKAPYVPASQTDIYGNYSGEDKVNCYDYAVTVPVNVSYRWRIGKTKFRISPYAGINFKFHIDGSQEAYLIQNPLSPRRGEDGNYYYYAKFEEDNCYNNETGPKFNRFQLGWQIGVNLEYRKFNIGAGFGTDIMKLGDGASSNNLTVGIGFNL